MSKLEHRWVSLCSDINTKWYDTYHWYRCANCNVETERTKADQPKPSAKGCKAKEAGSIFPLASI